MINVLDDPETIIRKFKRAVTDSETEVLFDRVAKPGVSTCWRSWPPPPAARPEDVAAGYTQYGPLKADTGEAVVELLRPIQERYRELLADQAELASPPGQGRGQGPGGRLQDAGPGLRRHRPAPRRLTAPPGGRPSSGGVHGVRSGAVR